LSRQSALEVDATGSARIAAPTGEGGAMVLHFAAKMPPLEDTHTVVVYSLKFTEATLKISLIRRKDNVSKDSERTT
jgi:hypothetical protein